MRNYITCANEKCKRVILVDASEPVVIDGVRKRFCLRCAQELERKDEKELLEEER